MKYTNRIESEPEHIIVLDRGNNTSCTVNLHGATVTSWRIMNKEMLFVSKMAHFTGLSYIRGGISFVFPIMGEWDFGPRHGFARLLPWSLLEGPNVLENGDVYVEIGLCDNPYTWSLWNYKFKLYYKITLGDNYIQSHIGVENSSFEYPFEFKIMQHSLLRVPNVSKCEIIGLRDCKYKDKKEEVILTENRDKVTITQDVDRLYLKAPNVVFLQNAVNGGTMKIMKKRTHDVNLWNPGRKLSLKLTDLGDEEYKNFIAVEAGIVSKYMRVEPQSCWEAYQTFEYVEAQKEEKIIEDFYDIFKDYC